MPGGPGQGCLPCEENSEVGVGVCLRSSDYSISALIQLVCFFFFFFFQNRTYNHHCYTRLD